jgi:chromate transporter
MMTYLTLAYEFFKVGLFSIGGGMATIPFLMDLAETQPWFTPSQLTDMIAIAESTPGPIGINMSTYAGFNAGGVLGGIVATFSLVFPSVVIICIVSKFMQKFRSSKLVEDAFYGLRPASAAMIAGAMMQVLLLSLFHTELFSTGVPWYEMINIGGMILFVVILLGAIFLKKLHPIVFILAGAAAGIVFQL